MRAERIFRDQQGVALPMAMIVLVLLTTLMLAFAVLSQTEPVIAHNHMRAAQARVHAEAGFERAVWALSVGVVTPGTNASLAAPLPVPTPAPYDGSVFVANGTTGGYLVAVTSPAPAARPNERQITSTGWTPTNSVADTRTKAHRRIQATVERLPPFAFSTPCALCVRGDLGVGGNALVDGTADTDPACAPRKGAIASGSVTPGGSSLIRGPGGDPNVTEENVDFIQNASASTFDGITLDAGNFKQLRELAKKNGTYFGPGFSGLTDGTGTAQAGTWSGSLTFNSSNKVKNGIVFVDTLSGADIPTTIADQNPADFAGVSINGNPFVSTDFSGWIVVNGSLNISGNMKINGLVYTVNDFTYNGTGTGEIVGLAISQNIRDTNATAISSTDTTTTGNSRIKFNCNNLNPPPGAPIGFALVPGSYRECRYDAGDAADICRFD
jgi:Tfp pilus assembly protein PilX